MSVRSIEAGASRDFDFMDDLYIIRTCGLIRVSGTNSSALKTNFKSELPAIGRRTQFQTRADHREISAGANTPSVWQPSQNASVATPSPHRTAYAAPNHHDPQSHTACA